MKRASASYALLCALLCLAARSGAAPLEREQAPASIAYVQGLQNPDGGFRPSARAGASQLGTMPAALRTFKYLGGAPRDRDAAEKFVLSCYDASTGGFADMPGGTPDVRSTAMGLMSLAELKLPLEKHQGPVTEYLEKNARTVPELYIAEAALDAAGLRPSGSSSRWLEPFEATRNPDGSYGMGPGDTARAVVTTLRLGQPLKDREGAARALKAAQRPDGGFPGMADASDLATTYPVMRAFFMLKERPDLARLRSFVARCRNTDGGYGTAPGQESGAAGTYFATIVLHWAEELERK